MNTVVVLTAVNAALKTIQELNALMTKAQMENRDITDDELKSIAVGNDLVSQSIIERLRR